MTTALVLAAHGSADPRAAVTAHEIADAVAKRIPGVAVGLGFLDHSEPSVAAEVDRLAAAHAVVVVPLLFAPGYHTDIDLPAVLEEVREHRPGARVRLAAPLGPHSGLAEALVGRLAEAGLAAGTPGAAVLLVGAGSGAAATAALLETAGGWPVGVTTVDGLAAAVGRQRRAREVSVIGVAQLLLAPGFFADRIRDDAVGADVIAAPLGAHPSLISLVLERFAA